MSKVKINIVNPSDELLLITVNQSEISSLGFNTISISSEKSWAVDSSSFLKPHSLIENEIVEAVKNKSVVVISSDDKKEERELRILARAISHQIFVNSCKLEKIQGSFDSVFDWLSSDTEHAREYLESVKGFESPGIRLKVPYSEYGDDNYLHYLIPYEVKSKPVMPKILIESIDKEDGLISKPTNAPYIWLKRNLIVLSRDQNGKYSTNDSENPAEVLSEAEGVTDDRRRVVARLRACDLSEKEGIGQFGISGSPAEFLKIARAQRNARMIDNVMVAAEKGWLNVDGKLHYLYGSTAITPKGEQPVLPNLSNDISGVKQAGAYGSKEKWESVTKALIQTNPFQASVMGFAVASAGLDFIGDAEPGVLHVYGDSSAGKTTTLQIAASLIGRATNPRDPSSWIRGWRTTDNGLEKPLSDTNHAPLMLDEIHAAPARTDWQATSYMIANGRGKERMKHTTEARKTSTWCLNVLSSGEVSMSEKIRSSAKGQVPGGLAFRVIDLYAGNIKLVDLNKSNQKLWSSIAGEEIKTNGDLAELLENTYSENYGHFWPMLIEWLRETDGQEYIELYEHYRKQALNFLPEDASTIAQRRTKHVANAMAGLNAIVRLVGMEDTKEGLDTLKNALDWSLNNMLTAGLDSATGTEAETIRESIESEIISQISRFHISGKTQNPSINGSLGWVDEKGDVYMPIKNGWNQICSNAGLDAERSRDAFKDKGWVKTRKRHPASGSGSNPVSCLKAPGFMRGSAVIENATEEDYK